MKTILNRLYVFIPLALVAILQNAIHEGLHYLTAWLFNESVLEFRFLTNGWLTSQVVYAAPLAERIQPYWLAIAWVPAVVTTLIGFGVYANRKRWITSHPLLNLIIWYVGVLFMTIDPLYFGLISWFLGGSDVNAAEIVGWPAWPFQLASLLVAALAIVLVLTWQKEARQQMEHYQQNWVH